MMYAGIIVISCSILCAHAVTKHCHGDRCYWISDAGEGTWAEGRAACQSEGGDLAGIETPELFDFVTGNFSLSGHFWIGFDDIEQESDFRWLNGAPLIYHTFPDTEPNEHRTENCGALKNEKFDNTACSRDEDILCSSIAFIGEYTGPYGPLDWYSAKAHCEALGQKLMTIDSQEEEDHVKSTLNPSGVIFLGVSDLALETVFRTVDGFVTPWANWDSNEPSGIVGHAHGMEDAVVRLNGGRWRDRSISQTHPFFCEAPRMFINGEEVTSDNLIDNDITTCEMLPVRDGCRMDKISIQYLIADREMKLNVTIGNGPCAGILVTWKEDWQTEYGTYQKCGFIFMDNAADTKYICGYVCDITDAATMEIKMVSKTNGPTGLEICDVKMN